ncbi:MAG: efflux transporter outer membrane subunit [Methylotenera sp.]|nr:efflux transporter outer membrane subunit [Methylotenera sp.]MSP99804.1 efflux transporter outer membrane subunit [Methylotenera sp.]
MTATIKKQTLRVLILLGISTLSTGCKVLGPDYAPPAINTPTAYKEAALSTTTETPAKVMDERWWTLYGNDELDQLIGQVELQNYSLQAVEARTRQARALAEIAKAAKSPTVIAGGKNDLGILASWEIDLWGRIQRNVEASGASAEASVADLAAMKLSLQAQLTQNYFNLRVQDAEIRLLQDTTAAYERLLRVTQNQYAVGVADRGNVLQVQTQLNMAQSQIQEARVSRAQLEHAIAVLIGKAPADFSIAVAPITTSVPEVPAALPADLLLRRPDIAAAERRMAAASAKIGAAEASAYPSLDLFAGVSIRKGLLGGAKVLAPLASGGTPEAKRSEASAAYDEIVANYQQTVLNGFREVEDNLASLQSLSTAADNKAEGLKAARESLTIMNNQQQVGIINHHAMMMAQTAALDSEKTGLDILAKRLVASVNLIKALGGGWQSAVLNTANIPAATK